MSALAEFWTFITAWYNLPFSLALLAFLGLAALQFIGLDQDHDTDAGVHADLDHDIGVDHDLHLDHDFDHDVHLDHDIDHDLDHDVGHDGGGIPAWASVLEFLGAGQAPLTMILLILLGSFGTLGWISNRVILDTFTTYPGWLALLPTLVVTLPLAALITSRTARLIGRAVPGVSTTAISNKQMIGRRGYVTSTQVDSKFGQVKVYAPDATLMIVFAIVDPDKPPLPRNTEVFLVDYDETKNVFVVMPSD